MNNSTEIPETRYVKSGELYIAYQVFGAGSVDLFYVPGFVSHLEHQWEDAAWAHMLRRLGSFSRVITFDKPGTGLSDRLADFPTLEQRIDDVRAVMDAVGSERAAFFGISEGGPMSILFAATHPQRTSALILYGTYARRMWAPDHPWGRTEAEMDAILERIDRDWGKDALLDLSDPSIANNDEARRTFARYFRLAASPGAALTVLRLQTQIDVRHVLPAIHVPALVMHRSGDRVTRVEQGRYLAEHIPGAKFVELAGDDHMPAVGNGDAIIDEIGEFLTGVRPVEIDRVLATILFTDIVGSTERALALRDRRWRELLEQYYATVRRELARFRGREIDRAGDGLFAAFDGPARAIRCACRIRDEVRSLGLEVRSGLHAGECEVLGDKIGGIAVHIGARVAAAAEPGEVLVSNTVKDLVAGSGIAFRDRGTHALRGLPGEWPLFVVTGAA
ncbi:MAG: adenylate/guanylate cyclase domain-containing protein [Betaproteobacteria bacterium]|nr:MAG: adenylate/guanylate cyclase domain-containing protein [Betaproteobacteria bacterium]